MELMLKKLSPGSRSWRTVRSIGNSKPVKLTILAPFIGYLIIYNDLILKNLLLTELIGDDINEPSSVFWRLFCLYIGFILLGIGSIIYQCFCPRVIAKYPTNSEFLAGEKAWVTWHGLDRIASTLNECTFEDYTVELYEINKNEYHRQQNFPVPESNLEITEKMTDNAKLQILREYYMTLDGSFVILREICFLFFAIGLFLVSIPSFIVFLKICRLAVSKLLIVFGN